ncbi:hypothetical protein EX30DRAFT_246033 [Ascodesmis nigricans]|uniref:Uncharacterized protein n=1 Tax=Ascodesmis nigricans TaxID=341454 RepID=A0A4S2MHY3_9PEZI|nr:hypothetical protein EX30DRAFT_246033 [Ascodesmis nigricans]
MERYLREINHSFNPGLYFRVCVYSCVCECLQISCPPPTFFTTTRNRTTLFPPLSGRSPLHHLCPVARPRPHALSHSHTPRLSCQLNTHPLKLFPFKLGATRAAVGECAAPWTRCSIAVLRNRPIMAWGDERRHALDPACPPDARHVDGGARRVWGVMVRWESLGG